MNTLRPHTSSAHLRGTGLLSFVSPFAKKLGQKVGEKLLEKAPDAAGKVLDGLAEKAKSALSGKGGALVQRGETLENLLATGDAAGNVLALQAFDKPLKTKFAKPPKKANASEKAVAKKDTKKTVRALESLNERR